MTSLQSDALETSGAELPPEMVAKAAELLSMGEGLTSFLVSRAGVSEERPKRGRRPRRYQAGPGPANKDRRVFFGAVAGALAVGMFFAGGAVLGGGQKHPAPAAAKLARAAAQAWLSGTRFSGPTRRDVGPLLDRGGPALAGQLEPAGSSSASGLFSEQFVVGSPAGAYGLSVVVYKGYVVYPRLRARCPSSIRLAPRCPRRARGSRPTWPIL
jgi:hypothetical protein